MTVTAAAIARVSPYTVGPSPATFDAEDLEYYAAIAAVQLAAMFPGIAGIGTALYDYCHALMACHVYKTSHGNLEKQAEAYGDASWRKEPGMSGYLIAVRDIYAAWQAGEIAATVATAGVERADADMGALGLDQGLVPDFGEER